MSKLLKEICNVCTKEYSYDHFGNPLCKTHDLRLREPYDRERYCRFCSKLLVQLPKDVSVEGYDMEWFHLSCYYTFLHDNIESKTDEKEI